MGLLALVNVRTIAALLVVSLIVYMYAALHVTERKIRRLGSRAPVYKPRLPFGLDIPYDAVKSVQNNTVMDFWLMLIEKAGATKIMSFEWTMLWNVRLLFTTDPENIKAVLTTQFTDFGKGEQFHESWEPFLGDSIFATDGKQWHDSRQLIRPMFMRERVADLDVIENHLTKLMRLMGDGSGSMVRLDKLLSRYTLDAATHFLFGISAGSLDEEHSVFGAAFDEVQRMQSMFMRSGPFKHFLSHKSYYDGIRTMESFMEPLITAVLDLSPAELETKMAKSDTFIHALARFTRDRKVIRDQLVSLLLAGRDTTAATLSWTFLELARKPRVVEKMRAEIAEVVGVKGQKPTYENIKDMKYLNYVINETLRLYPAVPFNVRASLKDTSLPRGGGPDGLDRISVPAGTEIGYSTLIMQRNRDLYPPISDSFPYDPLEWVPERWATWQPKAWTFIPFNGGPRICIGQQFAIVEMGYTLIRVLQEFDRVVDYGNEIVFKSDILLIPAHGVKVGFAKTGGPNHEK